MEYYFSKTTNNGFDDTIEKVTSLLKEEGFGVLTQIDVKDTLKKKLDVNFKKYKILGACNPPFAYKALQSDDKIGVMLPCNVVVAENGSSTDVTAIDPLTSMAAVGNNALAEIAGEVSSRLKRVIDKI